MVDIPCRVQCLSPARPGRMDDCFAAHESQRESICSQSQNSWLGGQPRLNLQVQQSYPFPELRLGMPARALRSVRHML